MAVAEFTREGTPPPATFTLTLTEAEARYVYDALSKTDPSEEARDAGMTDGDVVFGALGEALGAAGVERFEGNFAL